MASANVTPAGVYNDRVRGIFGMSGGGNSRSSTSSHTFLKKLATSSEDNAIQSAANDNRMLHEMRNQTKLLLDIKNGAGGGFGLTDFIMGSWLNRMIKFAGGGLLAGAGIAGGAATSAVKVVGTAVRAAAVGTASLLKGTILGVIKPITNGIGRFFAPLGALAKNLVGMLRIPSIAGPIAGIVKSAPTMLKAFGSIVGKLFWPITAILGLVDGIGGAMNAEEILGRDVNIFDRIQVGISSAINGVLLGLPNFLADKLGFKNLASMVDVGIQKFQDFMGRHLSGFVSNIMNGAGSLLGNVGNWIKDSFFGIVDWVKGKIDFSKGLGDNAFLLITGAVSDFGNVVKNGAISVFTQLGNWVNSSFDSLKKEINSWLPWNWERNKVYPVGTFPTRNSPFDTKPANDFFTPTKPTLSNETAPVTQMGANSPYDLARLAAVSMNGNGMLMDVEDQNPLGFGYLPTTRAVTGQTIAATQQIVETNNENIAETFKNGQEEIVDGAVDAWEGAARNTERNWFDLLKLATGNYWGEAKKTADAMSAFIPETARIIAETTGRDYNDVLAELNTSAAAGDSTGSATGSGATSVPGIMSPVPSNATTVPSNDSLTPVVQGTSTEAELMNYMMSEGLTQKEAAARVGNMKAESNFNPNALGDNGSALGLMQHRGIRRENLMKFAAERGLDPYSREAQARFAVEESRKGSPYADPQSVAVQEWMRANPNASVEQMTEQFMWQAERPAQWAGNQSLVERQRAAVGAVNIPSVTPAPIPVNSSFDADRIPDSVLDTRIKTAQGDKTLAQLGITNFSQLQAYGGQAFQGGPNDPNTLFMTAKFQDLLGDNFGRVTAQNDLYHQRNSPNSGHTKGNKTDFTVNGISERQADQQIQQYLASQGFTANDYQIISRPHGTGPHIDFKLTPSGQAKAEQMRMAEYAASGIPTPSVQTSSIGNTTQTVSPTSATTGLGFGMDIARNPVQGGKATYPFMDAGYDPELGAARMYKNGVQISTGTPYLNPSNSAPIGAFNWKDVGGVIAEGIVDSTVQEPKQPTFIPMEIAPGLAAPNPSVPGSKVSENPTGAPSSSIKSVPDLGSMPTIDELDMLLINTDMMGA